jgi:hypothetical protein
MTVRADRIRSQSFRSVKSTKSTKSQTKSMASSFKNAYNDIRNHGFGMYSMNQFLTDISEIRSTMFL